MAPGGPTERALRARLDEDMSDAAVYRVDTVVVENAIAVVRYAVAMEAVVFGRGGADADDEFGSSE